MREVYDLRSAEDKDNTVGFIVATEQFGNFPRRLIAAALMSESEHEPVWEAFNNWESYKRVRRTGGDYRPNLKEGESLYIYPGRQYFPDWYEPEGDN